LNNNIAQPVGLANGTVGVVMDIVYGPEQVPPNLPSHVWVDFYPTYTGPTFFPTDESRQGWIPVQPITVSDSLLDKNGERVQVSRTQLPLGLAWAWTIWKAQGQTYREKVVIDLADKEPDHGVTYVALSRSSKFENIGILGGISEKRFIDSVKNHKKLKPRLIEEERLAKLEQETKQRVEELLEDFGTDYGAPAT
jgi:ATP-dependent exoDNAse (exonuclease V) alpha subunit